MPQPKHQCPKSCPFTSMPKGYMGISQTADSRLQLFRWTIARNQSDAGKAEARATMSR